ncbi:hypothetical protein TBLA_0A09670 [Henningerozyma blattae CBS 6284]|uniref:Uncharacterized protein n=1 Tax=Henningerozyma blattae (strain ATCC 34711 / CBS 6284 / DSM 70876 / NBRC 10599 / NRRL Y-10934 / UCD 77-7) TaxID=1071380 RepID=I2GX99_HENB6|nr:hypothetical protein TBLA_0A09670 [Tetrapisispora blattae CBS 6284]CCH58751.1 hypothetical protein TBLA_0A09670 [Tetrapisispora blattae CBS 6284]
MYNPVDAFITALSDMFNIDAFIFRYALCLLGSFSFNAILKRLPDEKIRWKCIYIILVSLFYLFGLLSLYRGFITLMISTSFTYFITRFYRSRFMPHLNFLFVMGHLAISHIHSEFFVPNASQIIDITGSQMVLVMKLSAFAWSYYDGAIASKFEYDQLTDYQKSRAIKKHPSILKFLAYTLFYPTLLTGPSFDFADFDSWLNCEIFKDLPDLKKPKNRFNPSKRRQIPKNALLAFAKVLQGLLWMALSIAAPSVVSVKYLLNKNLFMQRSFFFRIHYLYLLGFSFRFKYYAAWTISEASCISCGLGYNGYDKKTQKIKWDRVQNIDIWGVEMAQSTHQSFESWNMNTNKWLKNYVYLRVTKPGQKPGFRATLFTFLTSAFWHGTRPGYYLSFATGALYQTCGKFFRRNIRPIFLAEDGVTPLRFKWIYDAICFYVIKLAFGYLCQPFVILDFKDSINAWKSVYFYIHFLVILVFFLFRGPFSSQFIKFLKSKQPKEHALIRQKKLEKDISESSGALGDILKAKLEYESNSSSATTNNFSSSSSTANHIKKDMNLGIPPFDMSEWGNPKEEWEEFRQDYIDWKTKNGLEVEEQNLKKAFDSFMLELKENAKPLNQRKMSFSGYVSKDNTDDKRKD